MFNNIDKRTLYIGLAVVLVFLLLTSKAQMLNMLLSLPGVIIAMSFHEFAHAFAAHKLGDDTAKNQGRMTLNPAAHLDPLGILMLVTVHFGWGRPVQVNSNNYTRKVSREVGDAIVSVAGPLMNFLLAILFVIVYYLIAVFVPESTIVGDSMIIIIAKTVMYAAIINIGLGVFNLLPIPPLDGSKIFKAIVPNKIKMWLENNEGTLYMFFIILWLSGVLESIVTPINSTIFYLIMDMVEKLFSLFI